MQEFSSKLHKLLEMAEQTPGFYEVEITFSIRLKEGCESYYLRLVSDSDRLSLPNPVSSSSGTGTVVWF